MRTKKSKWIIYLIAFTAVFLLDSNVDAAEKTKIISDKDISRAVETELLLNSTTPAYLIDVGTLDGIVTLTGSVDNILAQGRAVQIARTVKGVRGVVEKIDVDAPYRKDDVIKHDVINALFRDPAADSYEVDVEVKDGTVILSGTVDSWQEKQLSAFVAKGINGVKGIENNIDISMANFRSDVEIENEIKQILKNDIRIDNEMLKVIVKNGQVTLSGIVGSANEKFIASSLSWTNGVRSVNSDEIKVEQWAKNKNMRENKYVAKSDMEIRDAVKDAMVYDPRVYSLNPEVSVENGVVSLSGKVDNLKAKQAAENDAKNVVGVVRVKNYLKVRPEYIPEDYVLETEIRESFRNSPNIDKWEVDVTANNGLIYLNGSVDTYFEKVMSEEIASKTKGVITVENNIKVQDDNDYLFYDYYGWNTLYPPYQIDVLEAFKADRDIKDDIVSQLWWSPYVNQDEVTVRVDGGTAILEGTVDTRREKLFAEINALEGGALEVENKLEVKK